MSNNVDPTIIYFRVRLIRQNKIYKIVKRAQHFNRTIISILVKQN